MFSGAARKHIAFEETQVWPGLRTVLPTETAADLGTKIAEGKKTAPTRPHPHTPPSPGVLKTAGPRGRRGRQGARRGNWRGD